MGEGSKSFSEFELAVQIQNALMNKEPVVCASLHTYGAFDNILSEAIKKALIERRVEFTTSRWLKKKSRAGY